MCGIAGILSLTGAPVEEGLLSRMIAPLHHRGPDEQGVFASGPVGLAHARLSILDLSGGQQPMTSVGGDTHICFNGEIFNYLELREELAARGHVFRTRSDTEVLLTAWLEWGEDCVQHLNGQWAFAIWDARARTLFLSRDRMGIRPLYFTEAGGRLLFASEVKALFVDPTVRRAFDPRALDQIFTTWIVAAPRTLFEGVSQLPPGCSLVVQDGVTRMSRYWDLDFPEPDRLVDVAVAAEEVRALLTDATRIRLRADVPVGAYLSGGLDSTITTALARPFCEDRLRTFSVAFEDPRYDESVWQQQVVAHLGVDHHQVRTSDADIGASFPEVVWHAESPLVRTAPAPLFRLSRLVRESGFKVVLTGEGADEIFGGYDIFREARVRRLLAEDPARADRDDLVKGLYPYMPELQSQPGAFLRSFFRAEPADLADPFFSHQPRWRMTERLKGMFSDDLRGAIDGYDLRVELAAGLPRAFPGWDPLCQAQYLEARHLMAGYILSSQGDRMAMGNSVEGRFPFLDHRVVELAARLQPALKLDGMNEKAILKHAFHDILPPAIEARPKQPYRAPDVHAFFSPDDGRARFPYVEERLSPEAVRAAGVFDPRAVELLQKKAHRGRVRGVRDGMALCAVLSTQIVYDRFIA